MMFSNILRTSNRRHLFLWAWLKAQGESRIFPHLYRIARRDDVRPYAACQIRKSLLQSVTFKEASLSSEAAVHGKSDTFSGNKVFKFEESGQCVIMRHKVNEYASPTFRQYTF